MFLISLQFVQRVDERLNIEWNGVAKASLQACGEMNSALDVVVQAQLRWRIQGFFHKISHLPGNRDIRLGAGTRTEQKNDVSRLL